MKTVFNNDMVAHVWAQGKQGEGRTNNGNVYFRDRIIYSYGSHFPMAVRMGVASVIINADTYSISTGGHQSQVRHATNHMASIHVPKLADIARLLEIVADNLNEYRNPNPDQVRALLRHVESHPEAFSGDVTRYDPDLPSECGRWNGRTVSTGRTTGEEFAAMAGLKPVQVKAAVKRGIVKAAKAKRLEAAAKVKRDRQESQLVANMDPDAFKAWLESRYWVRDFDGSYSDSSNLDRLGNASRGLFGLVKIAKAAKFSKGRLASLQAKRAGIRATISAYEADAAQYLAAKRAENFAKWKARHDAATDDGSRFALWEAMGTGRSNASHYEEGTPERQLLDAFIAWGQERADVYRMAKEEEKRAMWLANIGPRNVRISGPNNTALVRRSSDGERLETSHGADVPWSHAVKAFRFIQACKESGEAFHTNGRVVRVGHFTVTSISAEGDMVAGCHKFAYSVMSELAMSQGVDMTASREAVQVTA